jgi:hypothetical protein
VAATRKKETAALAFSTDFRSRLEDGGATRVEISIAQFEGVLTAAQADRLRTDLAANQKRRNEIFARAERVSSVLQTNGRLDPQDPNDHTDVADHYAVTLKPTLADRDPAQRASAIRSYAEITGIMPEIGIKTLLALTVTGDPASRVAATRELSELLRIDAAARDRVPPTLATYAKMVVKLADTDAIPSDEIIKMGDGLIRTLSRGAEENMPNPGLIELATQGNSATVQFNGQLPPVVADNRNRKPTINIPDYRKNAPGLAKDVWQQWSNKINSLPDISPLEERIYLELFAAEGGIEVNKLNGSKAGVVKKTVTTQPGQIKHSPAMAD